MYRALIIPRGLTSDSTAILCQSQPHPLFPSLTQYQAECLSDTCLKIGKEFGDADMAVSKDRRTAT